VHSFDGGWNTFPLAWFTRVPGRYLTGRATGPPFDKQTMAMAFLHLSQGYFNRKTNIFHSQVSVPNIECEPSDKSICALEIGSSLAGIEKYRYLSAFYHI
jgi:hypothetical protein